MRGPFLSAADTARALLDLPDLADRWNEPSALRRMTIGELCAHLARGVTVVTRYLGSEDGPPLRDAPGYFLANFPQTDTDLDSEMSTGVRARATEEAQGGLEGVTAAWDGARRELEGALDGERLGRSIAARGASMRVEDYLVTRMVELVIHSDDLAASLQVHPPGFDTAVTDAVLTCLTEIASRRHTPLAVIRAMSRTERADPAVLRVF